MSRTFNTDPYEIQLARSAGVRPRKRTPRPSMRSNLWIAWHTEHWEYLEHLRYMADPRFTAGYPGQWGGALHGLSGYARARNRSYRARVKNHIAHGRFEAIERPRRDVLWDLF